jgi:hypothetical protein
MTRSRLKFLGVVLLILCFGLGATLARGGAWTAFEERCLGPMEVFDDPITEGLEVMEPSGHALILEEVTGIRAVDSYLDPTGAFSLTIGEPFGCMVFHNLADDEVWDEAQKWRNGVLKENRYEPTEYAGQYLSTTWREPRFSVTLHYDAKLRRAIFTAQETDLES